jgi:phytoene synthase
VEWLSEREQQRAYRHCEAITREHSRTFYVASGLLPHTQRRAIRALYAFCRVSDDLIDRDSAEKAAQFHEWRQRTLHGQPQDDDPVILAWSAMCARYHIPRQYAEQLLDGVASDLTQPRYATFADLVHYCYAVASTVGLMSMHIIGYSGKEAIPHAVKLGVALQLTNILRDVSEDWAKGRVYLPQDELHAFGLTEADIGYGLVDDRWRAFMRFQIDRARRLYAEALPGVALLGQSGRFAIGAAAELYRAILDDIEAHDYNVFTRRAHVSDRRKITSLPGIWRRARFNGYQQA